MLIILFHIEANIQIYSATETDVVRFLCYRVCPVKHVQSILVMSNPCGLENLLRLNRKFEISGANFYSFYC